MTASDNTGGREGEPTAAERIAEYLHERFAADHEPHWTELDESEQVDSIYADMARSLFEPGAPLAPAEPDAGDAHCTCAHDGSARRCPLHTQADYDASTSTSEPLSVGLDHDEWCICSTEFRAEHGDVHTRICSQQWGDLTRLLAAREAKARAEAGEQIAQAIEADANGPRRGSLNHRAYAGHFAAIARSVTRE
jgi:hypothetical protein